MKRVVTAALICLILDQLSKWWIVKNLGPAPYHWDKDVWIIRDFARLTLTYNRGLIFGAFQNNPWIVNLVIVVASVILVMYTMTELKRNGHYLSLVAVGMIFGGALGNTIDRIRLGKVVDFIAIGNFPVFNLADSAIVTGILLLVASYWVEGRSGARVPEHPVPVEARTGASDAPGGSLSDLTEGRVFQDVVQVEHEAVIEDLHHENREDPDQHDEGARDGQTENFPGREIG